MVCLEKMGMHEISAGNYVTSINGMVHPDRIMPEHDFLYILNGTWEIFENDTAYFLNTDDLLILAAGRHHYGRQLCNPGNRHMYLHIVPTDAEAQAADFPDTDRLFSCPTLIHCGHTPRIRQYFQDIIPLTWTDAPAQKDRAALLFSLLLCELSALSTQETAAEQPDPIIEEIMRLIRSTPQTFFSAEELSVRFYICGRTLNNRFRKAYGKTFSAVQMETKLEMVRQFLISQPQARLREAAANYGFYDEFHLSRAFKKQFGMSPSQYRSQR